MSSRRATAVLIARGEDAWHVLLESVPSVASRRPATITWMLPNTTLQASAAPEAVLSKLINRQLGIRVVPTELLPLGWYASSDTSSAARHFSALVAILPYTIEPQSDDLTHLGWWPLRAAASRREAPVVDPMSAHMLRDAENLAPADELSAPVVCSAQERHVPSMLSLLHSVRERTGGVTPAVWDRDLSDVDVTYRADGGDFLVAGLNDFVIAMAGVCRLSRTCAQLKWIMVHPRWRHRGIGMSMLAAAERRAAELGFHTVVVDSNHMLGPNQHLFRKAGFSRSKNDPTDGQLHYAASKRLQPLGTRAHHPLPWGAPAR